MKSYFVEVKEPKIIEVIASNEDDAINRVRAMFAQTLAKTDAIEFTVLKELHLSKE